MSPRLTRPGYERCALEEDLAHAQSDASDVAYEFLRLCEVHRRLLKPQKLDAVAQRMILAAGRVRICAHAVVMRAKRRRRARRAT